MKLFFDARYIRLDYPDGISRYTTELGNALARQTSDVTFILSDERQHKFLPETSKFVIIHPLDSPLEPFASLILNRYKPDIVVSPMQTMGTIGHRFKLILTLHDLIYYKYRTPPPQCPPLLRPFWRLYHLTYFFQRRVLNQADVVATVSETSKQEIVVAKLTKRPVVVVSNAARDLSEYLDRPVIQSDHPPKNLVFMSTPIPYKNIEGLLQSMQFLPGRTLHVLSKIKPRRKAELTQLIPKGAEVIFHNGVSDAEYAKLLADDAIMVSASKAEGFGLPLAEAMQLGVPAVVSDRDFYHEVGGDGAVYADPTNPRDFAEKIIFLDSKQARVELTKRGKQHITKFSWDKSAQALLEACKNIV